jgi:hypothetical protein
MNLLIRSLNLNGLLGVNSKVERGGINVYNKQLTILNWTPNQGCITYLQPSKEETEGKLGTYIYKQYL